MMELNCILEMEMVVLFRGDVVRMGDHEGGGEGGGIYTNTGEKTPAGEEGTRT